MKYFIPFANASVLGACTEKAPKEVVTDDSVTIHYEITGGGDTTLLFLHGWAIDMSYWKQQVNAFNDNYQVVTVDHAGHGQSVGRHASWSPQRLGKDIAQTIEQLGLERVILIGHSMSGTIMLET